MNTKATQLDQMLYAWLAESDDRKFDRAFQRYYGEASPSLVRYLVSRSSLPDLDCEQIAVDALLKFFTRVGRDRRQAAQSVSHALPQIQPLNLGPFHVRQVQRWTADVGSFKNRSMSFTLTPDDAAGREWKAEIQTQTDGIPPLQRQGLHLLEAARIAVAVIAEPAPLAPESLRTDGTAEASPAEHAAIRAFAEGLREATEAGATGATAAESRHPGVLKFVGGTWAVVDVLPALRIPTNGYLFDIAQSMYLDECKARGRKKRGGSGVLAARPDDGQAFDGPTSSITPFVLDEERAFEEADSEGSGGSSVTFAARPGEFTADPTAELIDEDFCEQFYACLRKPLHDAEEAYRQAAAVGKADAERKRLASVSDKHARLMAVLTMRIEGQTQEAIAQLLDLSRNQVKYIAEQVQAAYQQFCASAMRPARV
jgi:DNA-directed RNA polymerase specialized sigma24 family protein